MVTSQAPQLTELPIIYKSLLHLSLYKGHSLLLVLITVNGAIILLYHSSLVLASTLTEPYGTFYYLMLQLVMQ